MPKTTRRRAARSRTSAPARAAARTRPRHAVRNKPLALPCFHVDAFTRRPFHGNPAAVVLLERRWLPDDLMQLIAAENNLAETAFVLGSPKASKLKIRWFTPTVEVDLCGHATVAAAHVLWTHAGNRAPRVVFSSRSGNLPVMRSRDAGGEVITLDFPSRPAKRVRVSDALCAALGRAPAEVWQARDTLAVFENKRDIHELAPDMARLAALDTFGVIVTAPGAGHDFVSRFFAPKQGIPEDPVTGSAHCTLVPYWADRLGKNVLRAHQVSHRARELFCELRGDRVMIGGHAVTYSEGRVLRG